MIVRPGGGSARGFDGTVLRGRSSTPVDYEGVKKRRQEARARGVDDASEAYRRDSEAYEETTGPLYTGAIASGFLGIVWAAAGTVRAAGGARHDRRRDPAGQDPETRG